MKHKRSTFRRRQHVARNDQLPPYGQDMGPRFWISRGRGRPEARIMGGNVTLNRGTGAGTMRAMARERAR